MRRIDNVRTKASRITKSATSYDCINSLTKQNNHYTLLYPALVQELFNSSLHKSNSTTNISHFFSDFDKDIQKSSSLDSSLSPRDVVEKESLLVKSIKLP
ncbi:MAG: hypothetical protein O7C60_08075 [Rickettsia endosymbiont of Ixodes persulcatus]|nr:hypothetical protein [Rickettsia endosymbiont of Ixodes persulcatus]